MRLAKYFLLLIMLFGFALLVFVFTQDGKFEINKSKEIRNIDKNIVYKYLENFQNWNEFINDSKNSNFNKNKFYWNTNQYVLHKKYKNDSLILKYIKDNNESDLKIYFKKELKSTKISWYVKGDYSYKEKFLAFFYGNNNKNQIKRIENYLSNINLNLQKENFYYRITYGKIITLNEQTLIFKTVNCSINSQDSFIKENTRKILKTLDSVKIKPIKKPFIIYNWKDYQTQNTKLNLCIEIPKDSDTLLNKTQIIKKAKISYQIVDYDGNKKFLPQFWNNFANEIKTRKLFYLKNQGIIENINEKNNSILKSYAYKTEFLIPIYQLKSIKISQSKQNLGNYKKMTNTKRPVIQTIEKPEIKQIETNPAEKPTEN